LEASANCLAEKVSLEYASKFLSQGSDEAVEINERAFYLSQKQTQIVNMVVDNIRGVLERLFNEEDEENLDVAAFPADSPDLPIEQMHIIHAEIFDTYSPEKHYKISDFIQVLFSQPWIAEQAVEDIQLEEVSLGKGLEKEKHLADIGGFQASVDQCKDRIRDFDACVSRCV